MQAPGITVGAMVVVVPRSGVAGGRNFSLWQIERNFDPTYLFILYFAFEKPVLTIYMSIDQLQSILEPER